MSGDRLETLKNLAAQNPADPFLLYGLAMEYRRTGDSETAIDRFAELVSSHPDYVPAYLQYGQVLESAGKIDQAISVLTNGINAATRKGDQHAAAELRGALELLSE